MTQKFITAYIALGSNLNNPKQQIKDAILALDKMDNVVITNLSKLYLSKPLLNMPLPDFYNSVVEIKTNLSANDILNVCQNIEIKQHRIREKKWGSRTIDLDILLYGDMIINSHNLTIPHKEIKNRAFVLMPLADIKPQLNIPNLGVVNDLLANIDTDSIKEVV